MVKVKRYVRYYASAVILAAHGSGGIQLSIVLWDILGEAFHHVEPKGYAHWFWDR